MYGNSSGILAAGGGTGMTGAFATAGDNIWPVFAAITVLFAGSAIVQLVRRPREHRP